SAALPRTQIATLGIVDDAGRRIASRSRHAGSTTGSAAAAVDHLVQRQIEQVVLPVLAGHQHLAGIAEDLLHGVQIQALASHLGRLAVFAYQLGEAVGLTLGARYHLVAVTVGVLDQALGPAASL